MPKKYLTKIVCFLTLVSFLVQGQWFETGFKTIRQTHLTKCTKHDNQTNFSFDESEEDTESSDDSASQFIDLTYRVSEFTYSLICLFTFKKNPENTSVHHFQERPIWLTLLKIIQ